ncbi:Cell division control protein 25 [Zancudomyces culisetae]|nr:Cell division control protein 25 [Zancudomyces culisetae]|eukprot:OMH82170.1 Cell division control protein 25 [Zancudomyces culisetae]
MELGQAPMLRTTQALQRYLPEAAFKTPTDLIIIQKIISNESHIKNPENTDTNGVNGLINGTSYFQNEHQRLSSNLRVNQNYYRRNIKSTIASQRYENTRRASSTLLESETNKISADFETLSKGEGDLIKPSTGKLSISLAHQEDLLDPGCNEKSLIFSSCMLPGLEETNVALSKHLLMTKNQASYLLKRYSSFEKSQTQYESMDKVSRHLGVYCKRMTSNLGEFLGKVNQAEYIIRAYKVDEDKISFTEALDEDPENISKYISGCDTPDADTYDHPETGKRHIQTELLRLQKLREEVQFLSMDIVVAVQDLLFLSPQLYINSVLHNGPKEEQAAGENISTEICKSHESGEEIDPNLNKSRNIKYGREARGGLRETVLDSSVFSLDIPFKNSHQDANTNPSPYLDNTSLYTDSQHEQPTKAFDLDSKTHSVLVSHPFALFRPDSTERNTGFLSKLNQLTILLLRLDTTCLKLWLSVKYIFEICDKKTIETLLKCATPRNSVVKGGYRSTMNQNSHLSNSGGQFNMTQDAPLVFSNVELQRKHQPLLVNPKLDSKFSKPSGLNSNTFSTVRPASTKLSVQNNVSRMFSYKKIKNFVKNFKKPSKGTILSSKRESGLDPTSDTFGKKRSAFEMGRSISSRPSSISELQELTEDIYHNGLVFDSKKRVKCGTLENLVGYLTSDTMLDEDFISTFMLTFHAFISSPRFFNLLIDRYMISPPDNLQPDEMITWRERKLSVVRLKVINVFKTWLREYFEPRLEGDIEALNMLRTFASTVIVESYPRLAESLIVEIDIISSSTESRQSGLPANSSSLTEEEFSEYHQNAHIYSFYNFLNHKSSKYSLFEGARKNDNIVRQPISYIPENLDAAQRLIDSTPLSRLYKTWKLVPKPSIDSFSSLSTVVNPSKNFSEYRTSIQKISPPAIPYLGLVLSDLTFIEDGNSDYLGKDSHSSELLNFSKFESIASSIRAVLNFQSVSYMTKLTLAPDVISLFFNKLKSEVPISASHDNLMEQFLQTANKLEPK